MGKAHVHTLRHKHAHTLDRLVKNFFVKDNATTL